MGIKQTTAQYRLNYLWNTKIEIAKAINEVGKNKGISVNPRQDFAKFAEKILKLQTSVWSSANDSEDPHLTITENGYYKVSDLSLEQFGDASRKTVVSSFYVNVQSAPIIIGNNHLEYGIVTNVGTKAPVYNFNETFTGDIPTILTQLMSRLGIVMGVQAVKSGSNWTATFDNGKVIIFSESGSISTPSGLSLGSLSGSSITVKIIQNTKAIYFTTSDGLTYTAGKTFILASTDADEDAAWINLGDDDNGSSTWGNLSAVINNEIISGLNLSDFDAYYGTYKSDRNGYIMYNLIMPYKQNSICTVDFGENIFIGPMLYPSLGNSIPMSYTLGNSEFAAIINNSGFWQRL